MKYFFAIIAIVVLASTTGCTQNTQSVVIDAVSSNINAAVNTSDADATGGEDVKNVNSQVSDEQPPDANQSADEVEDVGDVDDALEVINVNDAVQPQQAEDTQTENEEAQEEAGATDEQEQAETETIKQIEITVQVVSPGDSHSYTATVDEGSTVEALMQKLKGDGFTYSIKGYGSIGTYITTINGLKEDRPARFYWIYYVNGSRATAGISVQTLKKGDSIKWNYEKEL